MAKGPFVRSMLALAILVLVSGAAPAVSAETPPGTDKTQLDGPPPEQENLGYADASKLATKTGLRSVVPSDVYRVEDLEQYGTFGVAPPTSQLRYSSGWIEAGGCRYQQRVDLPHWSDQYTTISVHGWWLRDYSTPCPTLANVDIYLQAYWCNPFGCTFVSVASNSRDIRAGGGSGRRVNARNGCSASILISYRGAVDVDLPDIGDPGGKTYSPMFGRYCYPDF